MKKQSSLKYKSLGPLLEHCKSEIQRTGKKGSYVYSYRGVVISNTKKCPQEVLDFMEENNV